MNIKAVTLDCAGTLVDARWDPPRFAVGCAQAQGFHLDAEPAASTYERLLRGRIHDYRAASLERSQHASDEFWMRLASDWCAEIGLPQGAAALIAEEGERRLFGPNSKVFCLFEDTVPALDSLRELHVRLAVISNWDVTLHRVLRMLEIDSYFEFALASLEEGVEKPDAELFEIALARLDLTPESVLHVGDDPVDDFQGAVSVGMRAALIDRQQLAPPNTVINTLTAIPEVLRSIG